jgi:hypothetical protein
MPRSVSNGGRVDLDRTGHRDRSPQVLVTNFHNLRRRIIIAPRFPMIVDARQIQAEGRAGGSPRGRPLATAGNRE